MEPITQEEAVEMRELLKKFYGPAANTWSINAQMYELLGRLIVESRICTKAMHLVPRPWDLSDPTKWLQRQVRQAMVRHLRDPEGAVYIVCMKAAARNFRTEFERAALGF